MKIFRRFKLWTEKTFSQTVPDVNQVIPVQDTLEKMLPHFLLTKEISPRLLSEVNKLVADRTVEVKLWNSNQKQGILLLAKALIKIIPDFSINIFSTTLYTYAKNAYELNSEKKEFSKEEIFDAATDLFELLSTSQHPFGNAYKYKILIQFAPPIPIGGNLHWINYC